MTRRHVIALEHGVLDFEPLLPLTARPARKGSAAIPPPASPNTARSATRSPRQQRRSRSPDAAVGLASPRSTYCALQAARTMAGRTLAANSYLAPLGPPLAPKVEQQLIKKDAGALKQLIAIHLGLEEAPPSPAKEEEEEPASPAKPEAPASVSLDAALPCSKPTTAGESAAGETLPALRWFSFGGATRASLDKLEIEDDRSLEKTQAQLPYPEGLPNEEVLAMLRKIKYFCNMEEADLRELFRRSHRKVVPRYSTVIREGSFGSTFYIVLQGSVRCVSSANSINVVIQPASYFGESSLVANVQRQADVTTLGSCELLMVQQADCHGLPVELGDIRIQIVSEMLSKIPFFKGLLVMQRIRLGVIMEVQRHQTIPLHTVTCRFGVIMEV